MCTLSRPPPKRAYLISVNCVARGNWFVPLAAVRFIREFNYVQLCPVAVERVQNGRRGASVAYTLSVIPFSPCHVLRACVSICQTPVTTPSQRKCFHNFRVVPQPVCRACGFPTRHSSLYPTAEKIPGFRSTTRGRSVAVIFIVGAGIREKKKKTSVRYSRLQIYAQSLKHGVRKKTKCSRKAAIRAKPPFDRPRTCPPCLMRTLDYTH